MLWTGLRLNISPWFMSLISPEVILFSRGGDSPCVCFSPSSTSRRESWAEKCYHQEQVYLLHLEVQAIPESGIQSPFISWTPLPVNHFPAASGPLCYRRTLIRSSIKTWTWTRSSLKECSKWEGRRWCDTLKGIISVKIVEFSFFSFCLTLTDSSTSVKSPHPALQVGWMCASGRVTRSWVVRRHHQRQSCCFPWHKVTFELWSQQEPRAATSHRSQIWSVE